MRCKQTDRMLVITEWQQEVPGPHCGHYHDGCCGNASRSHAQGPCPFDDVPVHEFARTIPLTVLSQTPNEEG